MPRTKTTSSLTAREKARIKEIVEKQEPVVSKDKQSLATILSRPTTYMQFSTWIIGDTPLITHAWSEKARREMLSKQVKATRGGREARDPEQDFLSSLYNMPGGGHGFPAMGFKNCLLSVAHKDKGVPRTEVMAALWLYADIVSARPALDGAVCDMPLLRIYGSDPENREDMVKIGSGLNKTASLAYRAQFRHWAFKVEGRYNASVLSVEKLAFLIDEAGMACGIGEWRNERKGMFGAFHRASSKEETEWERFAIGKGSLPQPITSLAQAAD